MTARGTQTTPPKQDGIKERVVTQGEVSVVPPTARLRTPETAPATELNREAQVSAPQPNQTANGDEVGKVITRPFPFPPTVELTTGSGFVIDGGRRVITNRHVVEGVAEIYVRNSLGDLSRARVERLARSDDLAVLILETAFPRKRSIMQNQFAQARAGVSIAVIGFPMTDVLGSVTPSITNGIVTKATGMQDAPEMFQLSAKMNKGNSGGAVVDLRGRVVGVAMGKLDTVKIMQSGGFLPEDINFAIHVNRLTPLGVQSEGNEQGALADMSLEEIYQRFIGSVVMIAGR
jgi:S1-C subfamily serine protease